MLSYKTVEINVNDLENFSIIKDDPFILKINWENVVFEFLIRIKNESDKLVIMGSGAYDSNKYKPPVFQRHAWLEDITQSVIYYNDPTLYLGEINLGWSYGEKDRHYAKDIAEILNKIIRKLELDCKNVLFYGSSAGGFMSMLIASYFDGAKALVNNPQTIVTNYYKQHVDKLHRATHAAGEQFINSRLNLIEHFKGIGRVPKITYLQNLACAHDMKKHVVPFLNGLST